MMTIPEYKTERFAEIITVSDFVSGFVDIPKFLKFCKKCTNIEAFRKM